MNILYDGHVHSPFCPHGTSDQFEEYLTQAVKTGYKGLTFTEHAPLPVNFNDPVPDKDSGMSRERLYDYFHAVRKLKETYRGTIDVKCGLEIDYIEGFEEETKHFLDEVGPYLDDAILSVHFLKHGNTYTCLDYSPDAFQELIDLFGSTENVHQKYYETVLKSIHSHLGKYKPTRIGHLTLANKFQKKYPFKGHFENEIHRLLDAVQVNKYSLDYNGAGTVKPLCGETYPPDWVIHEAVKRKIPLVYGSDAHSSKGIGQGLERLIAQNLRSPY
ncbi:histidinol-phosphatase HisJ [Pseudalkalibacillus hwajinpoensis]|uniref:histidinol-phosphatase HisJ n=1 Tax=Guptibacillus hwajinpoensis TaxID=208199 RepID=UPI00325B3AB3